MSHGLLEGQPPPSRELLYEWLTGRNVQLSDGFEITEMANGGGWRAVATRDLQVGETICKVPKAALLSLRTASLSALLPGLAPPPVGKTNHLILGLALALLHELRLGPDSAFWGYVQCLPRATVPIPALWLLDAAGSDGALALPWLAGTEASRDLGRREREGVGLSEMRAYYAERGGELPATRLHAEPSPFAAFAHAFSLISTRAFVIDLYHTVALCPYADVLNHSSAAHTSLASDDFVCHRCGRLAECEHDIPAGFTGVPFRLVHLGPRERERIARELDTVDMYIEAPVKKGCEIMNCYGERLSEARLLVEWGFVPGSTPPPPGNGTSADGSASARDNDDVDEFGGEGLTWDVAELCGPEVAKAWEGAQEGDVVAFRLFPPAPEGTAAEVDEERLLCAPSPQGGIYHLNHSGQASVRLFGILYLAAVGPENAASVEAAIEAQVPHLEDFWARVLGGGGGDGDGDGDGALPPLSAATVAAARRIRDLIVARLASMHHPELGVGELSDLRERPVGPDLTVQALPADAQRQAMALTVAVNERALLRSALERWDELVGAIDKKHGEGRGTRGIA